MLKVTILTPVENADRVVELLEEADGVRHIVRMSSTSGDDAKEVVDAFVHSGQMDVVLSQMATIRNWASGEISFVDVDLYVGYEAQNVNGADEEEASGDDTIGEAMILARAGGEGRLTWWYLVFMACAAIIAAVGIAGDLPVLIVGAMSLSPDLDPANASAVGFAVKSPRRALRALRTLLIGLVLAVVIAWLTTRVYQAMTGITDGLANANENIVTFVSMVDAITVLVAVVAGVAAMVAFVTNQGRTAVGVAISVTTIPAAAYIGIALASGAPDEALGGARVLTVNVVLLVAAQLVTLALLRFLKGRWRGRSPMAAS